jgi:CRISPR-associated protein Cas2
MSGLRPYLVVYDIRCPRRLVRLHRYLLREAIPLQYSVFLTERDSRTVSELAEGIRRLIDERADDVRIYPLPSELHLATLGKPSWPHQLGIVLESIQIVDLLDSDT